MMATIKCNALDCLFWDDGFCDSDRITYDPDEGCLNYELMADMPDEDDWSDDAEDIDLDDDLDDGDLDYDFEEDYEDEDDDEDDDGDGEPDDDW
jgi:hypothetical protein